MTTAVAIYGAALSTALALVRLLGWIDQKRARLDVRLFISPLVYGKNLMPLVKNDFGHPVVQDGFVDQFMVIRAHNIGQRTVWLKNGHDRAGSIAGQHEGKGHDAGTWECSSMPGWVHTPRPSCDEEQVYTTSCRCVDGARS